MEPLELLVTVTGLPLVDVLAMDGKVIGFRSVYKPELGLLASEDVFVCELCGGVRRMGELACPACQGSGLLHGYSSLNEPMPAVLDVSGYSTS